MDDDVDEEFENTMKLVNVNEVKTESIAPFVAAVEQGRYNAASSTHPRDKWYQVYSVPDSYYKGETKVVPLSQYQIGEVVESIEAVKSELFSMLSN